MKNRLFLSLTLFLITLTALSQSNKHHRYYDAEKTLLKTTFILCDTASHVFCGPYQSYYKNGKIESKGQYKESKAVGNWQFYFENGTLKMTGDYVNNVNQGTWVFYYENGKKSMEGALENNAREGVWKVYYKEGPLKEKGDYHQNNRIGEWQTYYEQGPVKSTIVYQNNIGHVVEWYESGKKKGEGMEENFLKSGDWKYFNENAILIAEGSYINGQRSGAWTEYFSNGNRSTQGIYAGDHPTGHWTYFYEDGKVADKGSYNNGEKVGLWQSFSINGSLKNESEYRESGEYIEYYPSHKVKVKGHIEKGKKEGKWLYYDENGVKEGECDYIEGYGTFVGYHPNGAIKNKGNIKNDVRIGQWELYDTDGNLTGYYKPLDEGYPIEMIPSPIKTPPPSHIVKKNRLRQFFVARYPEYKSVIISSNPIFTFLGFIPLNFEFYNEARIGYELGFNYVRNPFFCADRDLLDNQIYIRGTIFHIRQKFYFPINTGMLYLTHEISSSTLSYLSYINSLYSPFLPPLKTALAHEEIYEYSIQLGNRLMQNNNKDGFTIDAFIGIGVGYRRFTDETHSGVVFESLNKKKLVIPFHFGLTFGYSLSFTH